ncbi:hypothetical protein TNCV_3216971 [Trichonephila clavipes]|nr:hypothetical protein TNCV_3216971 [Trichonephila clavipes]
MTVLEIYCVRHSLVGKATDSWPPCHKFEPSTTKDPPCTGVMYVNSVEAQKSSRWFGVEVRRERGGGIVLVLADDSKLRGLSPKSLG